MTNLILFGPPGSGKGTQATNLVDKYQFVHISTGDLFRYNIKNNTPLGQEAKKYINKGELVPDSVTVNMLKQKILQHPDSNGFIFDGFPRNIFQANTLDDFLAQKETAISALLMLEVPEQEVINRILTRGKTSGRSDDNDPKIISNRYQIYKSQTEPVFDHYHSLSRAYRINGIGSIQDVGHRLYKVIDHFVACLAVYLYI